MDEMQLLEEFRAVVAPPDPGTLAQARARVLDDAAAGQASRRTRWPRLAGRWPKLALTGLAAAATATATAVTVALAAPGGAPSPPGAASLTVRQLAYRVADVAAARPAVRPGQWVYRKVKIAGSPTPVLARTSQAWMTADGTRSACLDKGKVLFMPCLPWASGPHGGQAQMDVPHGVRPIPVTYAELSSLPRSPSALDRYLASLPLPGGGPAPFREFEIISALLMKYVMPPPLTAELYRALGDIPGVTVDQHAVNVAGRAGIGFQITQPRTPPSPDTPVRSVAQLILDPKSYDLIGEQVFETNQRRQSAPRHSAAGTAILRTALVSGPGILP